MKKLFIRSLLSFYCLTLLFNGVSTANDLCVNDALTVAIPPVSLCDDGMGNTTPATITPIVVGGDGNYTYSWITPVGYTGPTNQAEITTPYSGIYILTATDGNMCTDTETAIVIFSTPPEVEIIIMSPTICLGELVELAVNVTDSDNDDNGTYFYNWAVTGSAIITGGIGAQQAILTATANTTVTVVVTDSNGCQGSDEVFITLNPPPIFPSDLPEILVCVPEDITSDLTQLDADILANVTNGTVTWYNGNPETTGFPIADPTNVNVPIIFEGIYAQITDNVGCQNSTQITIIYDITPMPDAGPDLSLLCSDSTPIFVSGSLAFGQTAQWSGANITDNGNGTAVFDPAGLAGSFTLTYTVTSQFGCVGSDTKEITIISLTGVTCNDNNTATINDIYNGNCECSGTPIAQNLCTDIALIITGSPIADGTYDAIQTVTSTGVVVNGSTVSHIAGDQVILNPGFTVEPNVYFVAEIIPCPMSFIQPEKNDKDEIESQD